MNYQRCRRLFELCLVIGGGMAAAGSKTGNALLGCFGGAILLADIVQVWIFHRCPNCGVKLEFLRNGRYIATCPNCGRKLDENG